MILVTCPVCKTGQPVYRKVLSSHTVKGYPCAGSGTFIINNEPAKSYLRVVSEKALYDRSFKGVVFRRRFWPILVDEVQVGQKVEFMDLGRILALKSDSGKVELTNSYPE